MEAFETISKAHYSSAFKSGRFERTANQKLHAVVDVLFGVQRKFIAIVLIEKLSADVPAVTMRLNNAIIHMHRRRDRIKILFWDGDGYVIYYKLLSRGSFEFPEPSGPNSAVVQIRASELSMLLDGIELKGRKRRPRYERPS